MQELVERRAARRAARIELDRVWMRGSKLRARLEGAVVLCDGGGGGGGGGNGNGDGDGIASSRGVVNDHAGSGVGGVGGGEEQ